MSTAISTPTRKRGLSSCDVGIGSDKKSKSDDLSLFDKPVASTRTVATLLNPPPTLSPETDESWFTSIQETVKPNARSMNAGDRSKKYASPENTCHYTKPVSTAYDTQTPTRQQNAPIKCIEATKALQKLDMLSISASKLHRTMVDLEKLTKDIDSIMDAEKTSFPLAVMQLKEAYQGLAKGYQERLEVLVQWSEDNEVGSW